MSAEVPHCNVNHGHLVIIDQVEIYLGENVLEGGRSCRVGGRASAAICAQFQVDGVSSAIPSFDLTMVRILGGSTRELRL